MSECDDISERSATTPESAIEESGLRDRSRVANARDFSPWESLPQIGETLILEGRQGRVVGRWECAAVVQFTDGIVRRVVLGQLHD